MTSTGEATYRVVTSGDLVVRYIPLEVWAYDHDFTEAWRSRVEFCAVLNPTEEGGDDAERSEN